MKSHQFNIQAKVWLYSGMAAWHFVTVPKEQSEEITMAFGGLKRGFGSLRVIVTIGTTSWKTSIFTDKKRGGYLLPLKAAVRKKEGIAVGDEINFSLEIDVGNHKVL